MGRGARVKALEKEFFVKMVHLAFEVEMWRQTAGRFNDPTIQSRIELDLLTRVSRRSWRARLGDLVARVGASRDPAGLRATNGTGAVADETLAYARIRAR